ncbi:MAG: type II toxin-antitoxin system RelE family toxin [Candidatus Woesearchaeota archaeon]
MVKIRFHPSFKKELKKTDKQIRIKILKQIEKISQNPEIGKPMKYTRKGTRELYIQPYRLSYIYEDNIIKIISLYHKDKQ